MKEITPNIFVGDDSDCVYSTSNFAVIHACKTCHQKAVGYRGNLSSSHPNYLIYESGSNLYLNMVDMEKELLAKYTNPIMNAAVTFIEKYISKQAVLIHCNQGHSRAPSIALIYLALMDEIDKSSYQSAAIDFKNKYPGYMPANGIVMYLRNNWHQLMKMK